MKTLVPASGLVLPPIGYGTFPLKERLVESVPLAIACGCRLVDTSDNYHNEEFVGRGLAACGPSREDVIVVTKFSSPLRTRTLAKCFAAAERRLGGRIDVFLLHWPYPFLWREQWRRMEDLYLAGRCRAIGVCNFDWRRLERLLACCRVRPMIDQFERHPLFQQDKTARFCRENGIAVMCYSPLARMDCRLLQNPVLAEIAARYGKTVGQVVLRWSVEKGDVPIPASGSERHIRENLDIFDFSLTEEEIRCIDALEAGVRIRFDPARRFTTRDKVRFLWCRTKLAVRSCLDRVYGGEQRI